MPTHLTIDPAHTAEAEWVARVRAVFDQAKAAGEVVDLVTRTETLTPAQAAKRLGIDRSTISRRIKAGEIATVRVGAHHRITRREFERYRDSLAPEPLFTYRDFAEIIAGGQDWHFAARQLREVVTRSRRATTVETVDAIHRDPGLTGIRGWDAIIGGVASMTGRDRVSDAALLQWCFQPERYCTRAIFDPFDIPAKFFWTDYLRTPVELRVRNVVYPGGNLEGV
ncbi:MAG: helix-turn-helix domain-containing protein [Mycobacterium sp.]